MFKKTYLIFTGRREDKKRRCFTQYLEYPWDFFGIRTVHISMSDRSDVKQLTVGGRHGRVNCKSRVVSVTT